MKHSRKHTSSLFMLITIVVPIFIGLGVFIPSLNSNSNTLEMQLDGNRLLENEIGVPKSAAPLTITEFTRSAVTSEISRFTRSAITALDIYDFSESSKCPELLIASAVSTGSAGFHIMGGLSPTLMYTDSNWNTFNGNYLNTTSSNDIVGLFAVHADNRARYQTDLVAINSVGTIYIYEHTISGGRIFGETASNYNPVPVDISDLTSHISGNSVNVVIQSEIGGKYDLNDELIYGLNNGSIVVTSLEDASKIGPRVIEYEIANALSNAILDIAMGDIDNDGDNDMVVAQSGARPLQYINDGTPLDNTWSYSELNVTTDNAEAIALADLDLDGDLDIITGTSAGKIFVFNNDGNAPYNFAEKIDFTSAVNDIVTGDMDNDGDIDIVCSLNNGTIAILENPLHLPNIYFEDSQNPFVETGGTWQNVVMDDETDVVTVIELCDLEDDGDLDIVAGFQDGHVYLYKNLVYNGASIPIEFDSSKIIEQLPNDYTRYNQIAFGDVDNDGDQDMAISFKGTTYGYNGSIVLYKNPGYTEFKDFSDPLSSVNWESSVIYTKHQVLMHDLEMKDIDRDGDLDIIFNYDQMAIYALKNNGSSWKGLWEESIKILDRNNYYIESSRNFALVDYGYDWDYDLFWPGTGSGTNVGNISAFTQNADPWAEWSNNRNVTRNPNLYPVEDIIITKLDNDNFEDIVFSDKFSHIYYQSGDVAINTVYSPTLLKTLWTAGTNDIISDIVIIDSDIDNIPDIAFSSSGSADYNIRESINNFDGNILSTAFSTPYDICTNNYASNMILTADFNKDGKDDTLFANLTSVRVAKGDTTHLSQVSSELVVDLNKVDVKNPNIADIELADIDNDGDIDIVITTYQDIIYILNRFGDNLVAPVLTLDIDKLYTSEQVIIDVTSDETLYSEPIITIDDGTTITPYVMSNNGSLSWTYIYDAPTNGTYIVTAYGVDLFGNIGSESDIFFCDKIIPALAISIHGPLLDNYSNGTVEIVITNNTDTVKDNTIGVNITSPSSNVETISAVYQNDGRTWIAIYNSVSENGQYKVQANATDEFETYYNYASMNFTGDTIKPVLNTSEPITPSLDGSDHYFTNQNLRFKATFEENITKIILFASTDSDGLVSEVYEFDSTNSNSFYNAYDSNNVTDMPFNLNRGTNGEVNLTVIFYDKSGNSDVFKVKFKVTVFPPSFADFHFIDIDSEEKYVKNITRNSVLIAWEAENCTLVQIKIGDGEFSYEKPYNEDRDAYLIEFDNTGGLKHVTIRFSNYDAYIEVTHSIHYDFVQISFPWYAFVIIFGVVAVGFIGYKIKHRKPKEESWKVYMDDTDL